jgi:phytoene synthase
MRAIDDLIDCHKESHIRIAENEKKQFLQHVQTWIETSEGGKNGNADHELTQTILRFHIPSWPMHAFATSMIYDIDNSGFRTLQDFITYSQGASVAPASIFVHLSGLGHKDGIYIRPAFDVKDAATPCAMFSYLVHIIRDFQKDQLNNLNYFADDMMAKNGLTADDLSSMAKGDPISKGFREMIREYWLLADKYRKETDEVILRIWPMLEPRYRLSLQIIFNLYLMVFERINIETGSFTTQELNPTAGEIKQRVRQTIENFR